MRGGWASATSVRASVASDVLGPSVLRAVLVVVTEVPGLTGTDVPVASPALDCAGGDLGCPLASQTVMRGVVASLLPTTACSVPLTCVRGAPARCGDEGRAAGLATDLRHDQLPRARP